jgi:hypothetical protein
MRFQFQSAALVAAMLAILSPNHALADAVSDALAAAATAYEAGNFAETGNQLTLARNELSKLQSAKMQSLLPAAPDGWTREDGSDMAEGMAMMGGGAGTEATYSKDSTRITVSVMADNPMVASMLGIFGNSAMMAMMGKTVTINGTDFLDQEGSMMSVLENRVMVQAQGGTVEEMTAILQGMDFGAVAAFDKP